MRSRAVLSALAILLPLAAIPAGGSNHDQVVFVADRDYALVMRGAAFNEMRHPDTPLLEAFLGEQVRFTVVVPPLVAEPHTFHLHGHPWLIDDGRVIDTILLSPGETHQFVVTAGGVGRNAGDWMYHCHVDNHAALGMWGIFRVYPFATSVAVGTAQVTVETTRLGAPIDVEDLTLHVDGREVRATIDRLGEGRYAVHAALPSAGTLVVTTSGALGESVARVPLDGRAPALATAHAAHPLG